MTAGAADQKAKDTLADVAQKRAFQLRGMRRCNNVVSWATGGIQDALCIKGNEIDQQPHLLACKNCVVDLRSGEKIDPSPDMLLFKHTNAEWHGIDAKAPTWESFVRVVLNYRLSVEAFMQRAMGSALWGAVVLHVILVLLGRGRNGKGVWKETFLDLLGDLAVALRPEILLDTGPRNANAPSPGEMGLFGARYGFCSETNERDRMDTAAAKRLSGGDTLRARNPHEAFETVWQPTHTLFLLTNDLPNAPADDYAFWNRVLVVDFPLSFVENPKADFERQADPHLQEKLKAEGPGILAWLVRGCLDWQFNGLNPPPEVLERTAQYRAEVDVLGDFIAECLLEDSTASMRAGDIYTLFEGWWQANQGRNVPSPRWLNKGLKRRYTPRKFGVLHFDGLRPNPAVAAGLFSAAGA